MLRRSLIDRTTEKEITQRVVSFLCVHFTPQSRLRLDGRSVSGLLLFTSTPQSIAKPSPGWNKVALLTAVRNSSCSCPFSVSLHPPQAALNSEPLRGAIVSMGLRGGAGGPKGRNRNLLWPPLQKGYKEAYLLFVYLNPSSYPLPTNHPHPARAFHPETRYPCRCSCPARPTGSALRRFR